MKNDRSNHFIWVPVRLVLGLIFIYSGLSKLLVPGAETQALFYEYTFLPDFAVPWIARLFPWVEFFVGSFLFFGLFTRMAAFLLLGFTCSFVILLGAERLLEGHFPGDCGCFAGSWKLPTPMIFVMDCINLFLILKMIKIKIPPFSLDALIRPNVKGRLNYHKARVLWGIFLILCMTGLVFGIRASRGMDKSSKSIPKEPPQLPALKQKGASGAPVEIIEFTDFQCPACGIAQTILRQLENQYPGKIKLIFKHYPLQYHQWAMPAHRAAECAHLQGLFWPFHDLLYQYQREWIGKDPTIFIKYVQALGMDERKFDSCFKSAEPDIAINGEMQEARQQQVNATPTFFINGERAVGSRELTVKGGKMVADLVGHNAQGEKK